MSEQFYQPPPLPDFLNRALWSPEQWKQWEDSRRAYDIATKRAANIEKKRAERRAAALRAAKAEREARRDANRQLKIERKQRKAERQADRDAVINSIRLGHVTVGQMAKATQRPPERLTRAIRWLLKTTASIRRQNVPTNCDHNRRYLRGTADCDHSNRKETHV